MAEILPGLDSQTVGELTWNSMPPAVFSSFTFLLSIAKTAGILFIIYLAAIIVKALIQTRQALRVKSIEHNVAEINHKLDQLVGHRKEKKT